MSNPTDYVQFHMFKHRINDHVVKVIDSINEASSHYSSIGTKASSNYRNKIQINTKEHHNQLGNGNATIQLDKLERWVTPAIVSAESYINLIERFNL